MINCPIVPSAMSTMPPQSRSSGNTYLFHKFQVPRQWIRMAGVTMTDANAISRNVSNASCNIFRFSKVISARPAVLPRIVRYPFAFNRINWLIDDEFAVSFFSRFLRFSFVGNVQPSCSIICSRLLLCWVRLDVRRPFHIKLISQTTQKPFSCVHSFKHKLD